MPPAYIRELFVTVPSPLAINLESKRRTGRMASNDRGMRQGDPISPTTFITYLERMMKGMKEENEGEVKVQGKRISNLHFADDIDLTEENRERLQKSLAKLTKAGDKVGLKINISKTKAMVNVWKDAEEEQLLVKKKR